MKKMSLEDAAREWAAYAREHRIVGVDYYELDGDARADLLDLMRRTTWKQSPNSKAMGRSKLYAFYIALRKRWHHPVERDHDTHRFTAAERSGRAAAMHKLAKRGGSHTHASPEVKRTASYKRAERLEEQLAPQRWRTPGLTRSEYERLADAWERAGFLGWADNYRAHVERHRIGRDADDHRAHVESHKIGRDPSARDSGPIRASRTFLSLQSAERYLQKIQKKHPEARLESRHPTSSLKATVYRVVWKTRSERDRQHRHRTPGAPSFAKQKLISRKIRLLVREGYDPKQAAAIAYRMYGASRKR